MKKIAIIGASYLQMPLIIKAKEMGLETHCFAWEDGAVCKNITDFFYPISILDKDGIYEKCLELKIDGITSIATDMAVPTISYVAEKLNLIANSIQSSLNSTHKGLMRKEFLRKQLPSPKFIELSEFDYIDLKDLNFPLIVKPVDRSGSRGVVKVVNEIQLKNAIKTACEESFEKKCLVEEFIEGIEVSVESISWEGNHYILAITDKVTTGAPRFVELAHHQPSTLKDSIIKKLKEITVNSLNALDIKYGAGHSEFKITKYGAIFIIEVGARMGGDFIGSHLVKLSTGYDFIQGVLDISLNKFELPIMKQEDFAGIYFLSKETELLLPFFERKNDFDVEKQILNTDIKEIRNSNDRSGYLIYHSKNRVELL